MHTIFQLESISFVSTSRYPKRKTYKEDIGIYTSKKQAESVMRKVVGFDKEDHVHYRLCFVITERELNPTCWTDRSFEVILSDAVAIDTYLPDGSWYESNMIDRDKIFRGRPQSRIRFKEGDIVEAYWHGEVYLGIVAELPPKKEEYEKISRDPKWEWHIDSYTVLTAENSVENLSLGILYGFETESQYVFPPSRKVSLKFQDKLRIILETEKKYSLL